MEAATKKRDDIKVTKAREQMEEARRLYEVLNKELHEELPALYDSRIPFFVNTFQTMFTAEAAFHQEYSKVYAQFAELVELLAAEAAKGTYQTDANHYLSQSPFGKANEDGSPQAYGDSNSPISSGTQLPKLNYDDSLETVKHAELTNAAVLTTDSHRIAQTNGNGPDNGTLTNANTTDSVSRARGSQ